MLAARLHDRGDLRVEEIPEPGDLEPREVRVRPEWCGICGTDLHEYREGPLYCTDLPQILGHEFSATVVEVGPDVVNVKVGDRAAVLPHVFCGQCYFCQRGRQGLCRELRITGVTWPWGGLAGEAVVPAYQAVPLPDEVSFEQGAILEPLGSVVYAVERSGLQAGDTVLITGGGPIGQLAVLVTAAAGAGAIVVSEPNRTRLAQAERLGVSAALDPRETPVPEAVRELTEGLGVDVSIECSGSQAALDACVDATRAAGTVAQIALHIGPRTVVPETWTWKDLTICGTWSFKFYDAPRILRQVASGKLSVEKIVTNRIGVVDLVPLGIEALADPDGDQVKILVAPGGTST